MTYYCGHAIINIKLYHEHISDCPGCPTTVAIINIKLYHECISDCPWCPTSVASILAIWKEFGWTEYSLVAVNWTVVVPKPFGKLIIQSATYNCNVSVMYKWVLGNSWYLYWHLHLPAETCYLTTGKCNKLWVIIASRAEVGLKFTGGVQGVECRV